MKKPSDTVHTLLAAAAAAMLLELIPALGTGAETDLTRIYAVQGAVTVLCFGIWPVTLKIWKWPGNGNEKRESILLMVISALLGVLAQAGLGAVTEIWLAVTGIARDPGIPMPESFAGWAAALAVLVILPAVAEELFFRGMMQRGLAEVMPVPAAAAITTLVFAAAHMSMAALPALLTVGIITSVLTIRGGKLKYSIAFHLAYNLTALILSAL